ncbi:unnamed protein product [Prorocentrum cordatum]|uniref:Uncharacterized protein n=1 Tax=Prorocentrum cordatum TaxID=2364126 RepID=A0ABN9SUY7_9DINO|nr:unnamed protein product [Polarella glacialis]
MAPAAATAGDLRGLLESARPEWNQAELTKVEAKLLALGVGTAEGLERVLAEGTLNALLRAKGMRAFGADTLAALRQQLGSGAATRPARTAPPRSLRPAPRKSPTVEAEAEAHAERGGAPGGSVAARAGACGVDLATLDPGADVEALLERLERLERMTAGQLALVREELGFAGCGDAPDLTRGELKPMVHDALVWQHLGLGALRARCAALGLTAHGDEPRDDLACWPARRSWEEVGVPVDRLPHLEAAREVLRELQSLEECAPQRLPEWCAERGLQHPAGREPHSVRRRLRREIVWERMPLSELRRELRSDGAGSASDDPIGALPQVGRGDVIRELGLAMDGSSAGAVALASRFGGPEAAERVLARMDLQWAMGPLSLRAEHARVGLPFEAGAGRAEVLDRLRGAVVWEQAAPSALRTACRELGLDDSGVAEALRRRLMHAPSCEAWGQLRAPPGAPPATSEAAAPLEAAQAPPVDADQASRNEELSAAADASEEEPSRARALEKAAAADQPRAPHLCEAWGGSRVPPGSPRTTSETAPQGMTQAPPACARRVTRHEELSAAADPSEEEPSRARALERAAAAGQPRALHEAWGRPRAAPGSRPATSQVAPTGAARAPPAEAPQATRREELSAAAQASEEELSRARALGVPVASLRAGCNVTALLDQVDGLGRLAAPRLARELEQRGRPTDELLSRAELREQLQRVLIQEEGTVQMLAAACAGFGLELGGGEAARSRAELLSLLAQCEWEALGVPASRLPDAAACRRVLDHFRVLDGHGPEELAGECRRLGVPRQAYAAALLADLRQCAIWAELPLEELRRECLAYDVAGPVSEADAAGLIKELKACLGAHRCRARGIPPEVLGLHVATQLLWQVDALQAAGVARLEAEHVRRGLAFCAELGPQGSVDRLRDLLVWEHMGEEALRSECSERSLDWSGDRRALQARLAAWQQAALPLRARGADPAQLGSIEAARRLAQEFEAIEDASDDDLVAHVARCGLVGGRALPREALARLAKASHLMRELPARELERERQRWGLPPVATESRAALLARLQEQQYLDCVEAAGIPARSLGSGATREVLELYEQWLDMPRPELLAACQGIGPLALPAEGSLPQDRSELLAAMRDVAAWERLPLPELRRLCSSRDPPVLAGGPGHGGEEDPSEGFLPQLVVDRFRPCYERMGIPVEELGTLQAAQVIQQHAAVEQKSEETLWKWYVGKGLPREAAMAKAELVHLRRQALLWRWQPLERLRRECAEHPAPPGHADERTFLVDRLTERECMRIWDGRGFQATRIGSIDKAVMVVEEYERLRGLGDEDLRSEWNGLGFQADVVAHRGREALLEAFREVLVWNALPLPDLERVCEARDPPIRASGAVTKKREVRSELIQQLVVDRFRRDYEGRGIQVSKIGLLKAAQVSAEFASIESMSVPQLTAQYARIGISLAPGGAPRRELAARLQDVFLLEALPPADVFEECLATGAEEELKSALLEVLFTKGSRAACPEARPGARGPAGLASVPE